MVTLSGQLVLGDSEKVIAAETEASSSGNLVSAIRLDSPGGLLTEGFKVASLIQAGKVTTVVVRGAMCASACFIALAAGNEKYVSYGARVGVHGASLKNASGNFDAPAGTVAVAKILKELGVPPGIIGQMVVTPADQMVWLSPSDLQSMGVQMTGSPGEPAIPLPYPDETSPSAQMPVASDGQPRADPAVLRRTVLPLIRALTDCVAQQALLDQEGVTEYRNGTFSTYVVRMIGLCPTFKTNLVQLYDRIDGQGQGSAFLNGPYSDDLPRAVLKRVKAQLDDKLVALNRQLADQALKEADERAARDLQEKADKLANEERARKEEADRQARMMEAEQKAAQARTSALLAESEARLTAAKLEAARQQQLKEDRNAAALLDDKATQCAQQQLRGLLKSGESAEVLANATLTICNREVKDLLDGTLQVLRLERDSKADPNSEELYREKKLSETHDRIVALAVQAKASVGVFSSDKVAPTP